MSENFSQIYIFFCGVCLVGYKLFTYILGFLFVLIWCICLRYLCSFVLLNITIWYVLSVVPMMFFRRV